MPSIFGNIQIYQVTGGVVSFGDSLTVFPKSAAKEPAASGSNHLGACIGTSTGTSSTNFINPNITDQTIANNM